MCVFQHGTELCDASLSNDSMQQRGKHPRGTDHDMATECGQCIEI